MDSIKNKAKILDEKISYFFGMSDGSNYFIPKDMPFMVEIIKEIKSLCEEIKKIEE